MGRGRPTRYDSATCPDRARELTRAGCTEEEIAKELGVTYRTLAQWKKRYQEFLQALNETKKVVDAKVEDSLFKRAMGFEYEEVTVESEIRRDPKTGENVSVPVKRKVVKKTAIPDVTACIFWLKNRQREKWRDVRRIEGEVTHRDEEAALEKELQADPEGRELLKKLYRRRCEVESAGED